MITVSKSENLVPAALIFLSIVPILAGGERLLELSFGAELTEDNARFFASPTPVTIHILSVSLYCILGALQFAPKIRRWNPTWHRKAGRLLIPSGLVAALSGLWMTQFYSPVEFSGPILYWIRILVGSAMAGSICLGLAAIRRRDFLQHSAWMIRGYALGLGAGTQVLTGIAVLVLGLQGELAVNLYMGVGWGINIVVAEWVIRMRSKQASLEFTPIRV